MTATLNEPVYSRSNGYSDRAFGGSQKETVDEAVLALKPYANRPDGFDTIVTTGMSGNVIGPVLAYLLDVNFAIVRKPDDVNNHDSMNPILGHLGENLLFIDDFSSSGSTFQSVVRALHSNIPEKDYLRMKFVGRYFYQNLTNKLLFFNNQEKLDWSWDVKNIWIAEEKRRQDTEKVKLAKTYSQILIKRQKNRSKLKPPPPYRVIKKYSIESEPLTYRIGGSFYYDDPIF